MPLFIVQSISSSSKTLVTAPKPAAPVKTSTTRRGGCGCGR